MFTGFAGVTLCLLQPQTADEEESNRSFGVITVTSSTSIDSYFAQKMAEVKQRLALVSGSAVTKAGDDNRSDDVKSTVEEAQIVCADNERKRKKKKRRHDVEDDSKISGIDEMQPKKSKKKTKQEIESSVNNFNDNDEDSSEGQKKKRKKSKKRKMDVEVSNDSVAEADCCSAVLNTVTSSNPLCETLVDDVSLGESRVHKKSKKRSKNVDRQQQCEAETNADNVDVSLIDTKKEKFKNKHVCELQKEQKLEDCRPVEKKKKKKSKNVDRC